MGHDAAGEARDVVNDDGDRITLAGMRIQIGQHGLHLRPINQAARNALFQESLKYGVAFSLGVGLTAGGLGGQAITFIHLLL
ncbi:MAG: hypothetical protein AAFQ85_06635 [Pseudomonadota bacterium]